MKLTTTLLAVGLMAGGAWAQNPNVIQNVQNKMNTVQQQKTDDSNAALGIKSDSGSSKATKPAASAPAKAATPPSSQTKAASVKDAPASAKTASVKTASTKASSPAASSKAQTTAPAGKSGAAKTASVKAPVSVKSAASTQPASKQVAVKQSTSKASVKTVDLKSTTVKSTTVKSTANSATVKSASARSGEKINVAVDLHPGAKAGIAKPNVANPSALKATKVPAKSTTTISAKAIAKPAEKAGEKKGESKNEKKSEKTVISAAPKAPAPAAPAVAVPAPKAAEAAKPPKPEEKKWAMNGKRDPFFSPVVQQPTGSGCSTGKKCLEIGQINLHGVVKSDAGFIAVVTNNLGKAYFLRENDPVFNGYVVRITGDTVVFQETYTDQLGKPLTREVVKKISTPAV